MRVLSATDAIQPAWDHARRLTLGPRSWRLAFKITAVAFFARLGGCNANFNSRHSGHPIPLPPALHAALYGAIVFAAIVAFVITLVFFYVRSRLQFVLFDAVLRNDTVIAPIWRRYGRATWYWIGLKIAFFVIALACVSPLIVPLLVQFVHVAHAGYGHAGQVHALTAAMFGAMFRMFGVLFLAFLVIGVGYMLLVDFGLPSMALEGTSLTATVRRVWTLLSTDTGQVLLYTLIRFLLGLVVSICCGIAVAVATLVAMVPLGTVALVTWLGLRHASLDGHIVMVALLALLSLIFVLVIACTLILLFGYAQVFFQAYALYFLAGRYPLLAQYLEPPPPPAPPYDYPAPTAEMPPI